MKTAVIYARFSCEKQKEESIEGQIRICTEYAAKNDITVIDSYIDRAISGTTDEHPSFQRMIEDAVKHKFDIVLVYALNRFSRDVVHYYTYKSVLMTNNVVLLSTTEEIPSDPSGIILESVMVGFNQYYSKELAEKIRRGQYENAMKLKCNGGGRALGYDVDEDGHYIVNREEASVVCEIFERFANGDTIKEITDSLNSRGILTKKQLKFTKSSLYTLLRNRKYLGTYIYGDICVENAFEAIVTKELFDRAQNKMKVQRKAHPRKEGNTDFILTSKLFCGECGGAMIGDSGTGKNGTTHYYYKCGNAKRKKGCHKKAVRKDWIENVVIEYIMKIIYDTSRMREIADMVMYLREQENPILPILRRELSETDKEIKNLVNAIAKIGLSDKLEEKLMVVKNRKEEIAVSIRTEELKETTLTKEEVLAWLYKLKSLDINDIKQKRQLVNVFVNSIYLYDEWIVMTFNYYSSPIVISIESIISSVFMGSDARCSVSPTKNALCLTRQSAFFERCVPLRGT